MEKEYKIEIDARILELLGIYLQSLVHIREHMAE